jgi:2-polyprenyl-6-methoxyphenol hydroxylase-like FAD-dependent oxidoreductase
MARRIVDREGEVADALKEFEGWHPQICEIIRSVDATNRWALYDRDPLPRWTVGRVTLMGDAAHPMLPYMAQGAVQSIEDAAVLAKCLELADAHDVTAALQRYEQTRKPRASRCQEGSRRNAVMYHLLRRRRSTKTRRQPRLCRGRPAASERMALRSRRRSRIQQKLKSPRAPGNLTPNLFS